VYLGAVICFGLIFSLYVPGPGYALFPHPPLVELPNLYFIFNIIINLYFGAIVDGYFIGVYAPGPGVKSGSVFSEANLQDYK